MSIRYDTPSGVYRQIREQYINPESMELSFDSYGNMLYRCTYVDDIRSQIQRAEP